MKATTRRQAELVERMQAFAAAHPTDDAAFAPIQARLDTLAERLQTLANLADDGDTRVRDAVGRMAEVRRLLVQDLLPHVRRVADAARAANATLQGTYVRVQDPAPLLTVGRAAHQMLEGVIADEAVLRAHGLAATAKPLLIAATTRFDALRAQRNLGRNHHVGARAALRAIGPELQMVVALFDGFTRLRFGPGTHERAEWRRVIRRLGAPRPTAEPPMGGDVAPAA